MKYTGKLAYFCHSVLVKKKCNYKRQARGI